MLMTFETQAGMLTHLAKDESDTVYLILKNFQCFAEYTLVPFRPLTFLYGPNSAGKSAIGDAISMLHVMLDKRQKDAVAHFYRWERKPGEVSVGLSVQTDLYRLFLAEESRIENNRLVNSYVSRPLFKGQYFHDWESMVLGTPARRMTWMAEVDAYDSAIEGFSVVMEVFVDECRLGRFDHYAAYFGEDEDDEDRVVFEISEMPLRSLCGEVDQRYAWLFQPLAGDQEWVDKSSDSFAVRSFFTESAEVDLADSGVSVDIYGEFRDEGTEAWEHAAHNFLSLIFCGVPRLMRASLDERVRVSGIRYVPFGEELLFDMRRPRVFDSVRKSQMLPLPAKPWEEKYSDSLRAWQVLAGDIIADRFGGTEDMPYESMLSALNRWLSDEHFFGTSHTIGFSIEFVISEEFVDGRGGLKRRNLFKNDVDSKVGAFLTLSICDPDGREMELSDVGSGFAQIIPVVIATLGSSPLVMIEQPELHLHPRLQGALCDLFLESLNRHWVKNRVVPALEGQANQANGWFRIIETHSEHIALRLLRRIRESSVTDIPHSRFHVRPEDVAVLYFEPENGKTWLHEIRIGSDGEFIDRWPKGFFDERDEDIFGEAGRRN